jgi:tetratricopeptide (TPR) repeat protein
VVGRDELIAKVWAGTHVTKAVLKVAVRAIREALEDAADSPRYVETVGGEGYRFIGNETGGSRTASPARTATPATVMVGRGDDLAMLRVGFERALAGARQIVFVAGEAGIGKTTLIDRFVAELESRGSTELARGQCLEQYGESEAYLPVLEAIGGLLREDATHELGDVLQRHAPTWVSLFPAVEERPTAGARTGAAIATTPASMLREMADALEVFTRQRALVLVLEDLQWSDPSTVDLIACIARRRQPSRLMVIATLRPADVIVHDHPLRLVKQELQANGQCMDVTLELLSITDVAAYLSARFGVEPSDEMQRLAARIFARTEGNALFMVNVVNDLVVRGLLVQRDGHWQVEGSIEQATDRIPLGLVELIGRRLQGLAPATRRALEAASVCGDEFAVASVAAAVGDDAETLEDLCEELAAQGALIAEAGIAEWPDGSISGRYRFLHALYRHVLYERIAQSRRIRLHRAIGLREERAFGVRAGERASQLAMHFARGHDWGRALTYHELAASAALDRNAAHEALAHFTAALDGLARTADAPDRVERELGLVVASATLLMAIRGYAAPETERAFARARTLCDALPASPARYPVLRGLVSYHQVRAALDDAHALGELLLRHAASRPDDRPLRVQAHYGHGATLFHMGALDPARGHFETALLDYDPATHREHVLVYGGYDPGVASSLWLAWTLALMGRLDEAASRDREGLERARHLGDAFSLAWACHAAAISQQMFGDWPTSEALADEAVRLATEHGFAYVLGLATIDRGWALMMQGHTAIGIPLLRQGVAAVDATGARLVRPVYLGMLAAADAIEGQGESAARRFDEALAEVERTGERVHEAGLLIGKSDLLVAGASSRTAARAAEECLRRALAVARAQGARLVELRAAVALARLCRKSRRTTEARALLVAAHAPFVDTRPAAPEIVAARGLLADLGR